MPLIGVDKVHRELGITGRGIGVFIIDWFSYPGDHGYSVMDIIRAIAPEVDIWYCDATGLPKEEIIPRCLEGLFQKPDIYQRIYVMNMSFKSGMFFAPHTEPCDIFFGPQSTAIREFTKYRLAVASAGNDGYTNAILFPACLSEVMSVGASYDSSGEYIRYDSCSEVTHVDWLTCYSNRAYFLDIVAPGTIVSTPSNPNFGGTSAAAPIVTGVAALMFSANPNLTPAQVRQIMKQTADLAYDPVNDQFFPRINAYRAVKAVLPYIPPPPVVNQPPAAAFTYSPVNPKPGDVIVFDCSPSRDPDGSVVSCQWNFFGQGTHISELGKLHYHRFDHEGTFVVVLTVYDNLGLSSSTSQTIT
ncbi:MAG: S8 family serine peptidase, partial [Candidatus Methanomethylicaceae archaeon]